MTPKHRVLLVVFLLAYPLDQLTKAMVSAHIPIGSVADRIPVITDFFYISHVRNSGAAFGLLIEELRLLARAVLVLGRDGTVRYVQIVPELTDEPDYDAALDAVRALI